MQKNVLLGVLLISTISLSAQQRSLIPQTEVRAAVHHNAQIASQDESALLEECYLAEEMATFDLGLRPERMQPDKVAEVPERADTDISRDTKKAQARQSKTFTTFAHFPRQVSGPHSAPLSIPGNPFQAPGLLSIIPKLFLSIPSMFRMIGK